MVNIKEIYETIFIELTEDKKLLDLLNVPYENLEGNDLLVAFRKQILENSIPDDLLNDYSTRLCTHEQEGGYQTPFLEIGYIAIDIHITKNNNEKDRRGVQLMTRIIEILDTRERKKRGLERLPLGLEGLEYKERSLNQKRVNTGWEKFTLVFKYTYLR